MIAEPFGNIPLLLFIIVIRLETRKGVEDFMGHSQVDFRLAITTQLAQKKVCKQVYFINTTI